MPSPKRPRTKVVRAGDSPLGVTIGTPRRARAISDAMLADISAAFVAQAVQTMPLDEAIEYAKARGAPAGALIPRAMEEGRRSNRTESARAAGSAPRPAVQEPRDWAVGFWKQDGDAWRSRSEFAGWAVDQIATQFKRAVKPGTVRQWLKGIEPENS